MTRKTKAYLALLFICIVWGTTYMAIRVGVLHYPAFLFAGVRQIISGLIIVAIGLMMSRKVDLSANSLKHQLIVGFLLITMGNGLVTWGEKYVPSGVAALICSMMPIFAVLFNLVGAKKEKINGTIILGMILGFSGVAFIFRDSIAELANTSYLLGIFATLVATCCWALGSVYNKKKTSTINPVFNAGLQLLFGGAFLLGGSPLVDDYTNVSIVNAEALWSLLYLIVFGSVLAYTAYMYTLEVLPVGIVTTYAYVNPLVAVIVGYMVLSEPLTWFTALSFVTIMLGVWLVNYGYRRQSKNAKSDFGVNAISALPNPANAESKKL